MPEIDRDMGRHDAQIESLQAEVHALRADVAKIMELLNRTKGGWQALSLAAGIAGAIGAGLMKFMLWSTGQPH